MNATAYRLVSFCSLALLIFAGCTSSGSKTTTETAPLSETVSSQPGGTSESTPSALPASQAELVITTDGTSQVFDRRLLGTNVPAWLAADSLGNPLLQQRITDLGPTLLRLPGGSWSNYYDWLACEQGNDNGCYWTWAARPTDFINFVRATGQEAMWTVSINGTAGEAAALVAFFNGRVDDDTVIGSDVRGRDWGTVGQWARLRAERGNPEPLPIRLWEVGNEVYGGKEGAGADCSPWGWEDVWTCDGVEYVFGKGVGTTRHEGYLEFRQAMRAVDPEILVGAVGIDSREGWSNWGNEVIQGAGPDLDFYVVHRYGFDGTPSGAAAALAVPQQTWPRMVAELNAAFDEYVGRRVPIAVTEYNLVAFQESDGSQLMRRAVNALFIADTIGQMAEQGIAIANQWNLANGVAENGTDYGMVDSASFDPAPQYFALALWQRFGAELLPVTNPYPADRKLSVYAGRTPEGTITLMAINKSNEPIDTSVGFTGITGQIRGERIMLEADTLESPTVRLNGQPNWTGGLDELPPGEQFGPFTGDLAQRFPPFSITLVQFTPGP